VAGACAGRQRGLLLERRRRSSSGRHLPSSPSLSIRAGIRCGAMPKAPANYRLNRAIPTPERARRRIKVAGMVNHHLQSIRLERRSKCSPWFGSSAHRPYLPAVRIATPSRHRLQKENRREILGRKALSRFHHRSSTWQASPRDTASSSNLARSGPRCIQKRLPQCSIRSLLRRF
jgi:hypothetical protein